MLVGVAEVGMEIRVSMLTEAEMAGDEVVVWPPLARPELELREVIWHFLFDARVTWP